MESHENKGYNSNREYPKTSHQISANIFIYLMNIYYEEKLHKLNLLTLCSRRLQGDIIERIFKILTEKYDKPVTEHT